MHGKQLYTAVGVVAALAVIAYFFYFMNNPLGGSQQNPANDALQAAAAGTNASGSQGPNSVVTQDVKIGTGAEVKAGDVVSVNYIGKLQDGTVFDQSSAHGGPFQFTLGAGQVIPGWDQGLMGMKVGGTRVLVIPPTLAYGSQQVGPIPPNSTLTFQVELVGIASATDSGMTIPEGPSAE